jgi:hypothetical protein
MKLEVLRNKKNLAGTKIRVDEDLSVEDRRIRSELIPYLKDAKKWGHKAFLRRHTLMVNGKTYGLNYLKDNIQLADVDNPGNGKATIPQQWRGASAGSEANDRLGGWSTPPARPWGGMRNVLRRHHSSRQEAERMNGGEERLHQQSCLGEVRGAWK